MEMANDITHSLGWFSCGIYKSKWKMKYKKTNFNKRLYISRMKTTLILHFHHDGEMYNIARTFARTIRMGSWRSSSALRITLTGHMSKRDTSAGETGWGLLAPAFSTPVQNFFHSESSGGLTSTFLFPTSIQFVLRTVPPDSICKNQNLVMELILWVLRDTYHRSKWHMSLIEQLVYSIAGDKCCIKLSHHRSNHVNNVTPRGHLTRGQTCHHI